MANRSIQFIRVNYKRKFFRDLFYWLVQLSWPKLISYIFSFFVFINLLFAIIYSHPAFEFTPSDLTFWERFFFSVHTFATVGYGNISPEGILTNSVVFIEIFIGLLSAALITGLLFSKFSQPKSFIEFSNVLLFTKFRGQQSLVFRMINDRFADVINMKIHMNTIMNEVTQEGQEIKNIISLDLKKPFLPMFVASYTGIHIIDENSPLNGVKFEDLINLGHEFFISVEGIDTSSNDLITGKHWYNKDHLVNDKLFEDMLVFEENGVRTIDYSKLDILK